MQETSSTRAIRCILTEPDDHLCLSGVEGGEKVEEGWTGIEDKNVVVVVYVRVENKKKSFSGAF